MKTPLVKKENINPKWHVVDADGKVLGRLASRIAFFLRSLIWSIRNISSEDWVDIFGSVSSLNLSLSGA